MQSIDPTKRRLVLGLALLVLLIFTIISVAGGYDFFNNSHLPLLEKGFTSILTAVDIFAALSIAAISLIGFYLFFFVIYR